MEVFDLRTNYKINPIGIDAYNIFLNWKIKSNERNVMQTAYQVQAAYSQKDLLIEKNLIWDTKKVNSDQSIQIKYEGDKLLSGQRVYWRVKVWDNKGNRNFSKEKIYFETGINDANWWKANWITSSVEEDISDSTPCIHFRKEFDIEKKIKEARLYISALGLYEANLNGRKVGNQVFTPGWTTYQKRVQYQVYDITNQVKEGKNAIGIILGDGWYRGYLVWQGNKNLYGEKAAIILQLKILYEDETEEWIITDKSWKSNTGPILKSDIYNGEIYDARLELTGWDKSNYSDQQWKNVEILDHPKNILTFTEGSPIEITGIIKPVKKITTPKKEIVFDFGQNIVGWIRFRLKGEKGSKIKLHHAEVLDEKGNFYIENLREAKAEDTYIFKGNGVEIYEPRFTFHGFRFVRISDYPGNVNIDEIEGCVVHSAMEETGSFECSDDLINQLQKNIKWGLKGNFIDVPTDCPQRDERLGWTGDAQVFAPTACFNVNAAPFYKKWLRDLSLEQKKDGSVPWVVPNVIEDGGGTGWSDGFGATGWADAAVTIPWTVYLAYGDKHILAEQYESMRGWIEYMIRHASDRFIFDYGFHFGDWLSFAEYYSYNYNAPDYGYAGAYTEKDLIATAYFYHSAHLMSKIAKILGNKADQEKYESILPKIKSAFQKEFITSTGRLTSGTQTAYVLALVFNLIPDEKKEIAAKRLADDVRYFGHLTTGFLGTPLICKALSDNNYVDLAYLLLFNKRYPSWLYPVTMGATTIWERWDGIKPDGTFQTAGMNSFNHYAYGAVGHWLYSYVAGIQIDENKPGYKNIIIYPLITNELKFVKASLKSMYGDIISEWQKDKDKIIITVQIPENTTANLIVNFCKPEKIKESGTMISKIPEIKYKINNDEIIISLGSGRYTFEIK